MENVQSILDNAKSRKVVYGRDTYIANGAALTPDVKLFDGDRTGNSIAISQMQNFKLDGSKERLIESIRVIPQMKFAAFAAIVSASGKEAYYHFLTNTTVRFYRDNVMVQEIPLVDVLPVNVFYDAQTDTLTVVPRNSVYTKLSEPILYKVGQKGYVQLNYQTTLTYALSTSEPLPHPTSSTPNSHVDVWLGVVEESIVQAV